MSNTKAVPAKHLATEKNAIKPTSCQATSNPAPSPVAFIASLAAIMLTAMTIETANASDMMQITLCNQDGDSRISVAFVDNSPESARADGWYRIQPNSCNYFYRHTGSRIDHHLFFWSSRH